MLSWVGLLSHRQLRTVLCWCRRACRYLHSSMRGREARTVPPTRRLVRASWWAFSAAASDLLSDPAAFLRPETRIAWPWVLGVPARGGGFVYHTHPRRCL